MSTKTELRKALGERVERERAGRQGDQRILEGLPDGLDYLSAYSIGYRCDGSIELEAENRAEAFKLTRTFLPVEAVRVKGSCLSYMPAAGLKQAEAERDEVAEIFPVIFKGDKVAGNPISTALCWWAKLGNGALVKVTVKLKTDPLRYEPRYTTHGQKETLIGFDPILYPGGNLTKWWASDNTPNPITVYWFPAEEGAALAALAGIEA